MKTDDDDGASSFVLALDVDVDEASGKLPWLLLLLLPLLSLDGEHARALATLPRR